MSGLSAFLKQNALKPESVKYVVSKRFVDEKGNPIEWEIRAITAEEDEAIRKACIKRVPIPGKKGQYTYETDTNLYLAKLAAASVVYPDLNDAQLQDSYGVLGAENLLKAMLTPGEYAELIQKVQEVNGYDLSFEELVDEAKN